MSLIVSGTIERLSLVAEAKSKLKVGDKVMALIGGGGYAGRSIYHNYFNNNNN